MAKERSKGSASKKCKAYSKAQYETFFKQSKQKIGPYVGNECFLISQTQNMEGSTLDGK